MKTTAIACTAFLASAVAGPFVTAFVPTTTSFVISRQGGEAVVDVPMIGNVAVARIHSAFNLSMAKSSSARFLGQDDEDEDDEDEDDEDDDDVSSLNRYSGAKSPFTGLKLDPYDPNPLIKPRPSRFFKEEDKEANKIPDDQLVQTMSTDERKENLAVMRQIRKSDLPDLRLRKDHAGWVEANNDLKRRYNRDPWFGVNDRLRDAILLGEAADKVEYLKNLASKLGGPPPGLTIGRKGYAVLTEIYDISISPSRAASVLEREVRAERAAKGRAMMAERKKNLEKQQQQYEEDMRNPGVRREREGKERRERTMKKLLGKIDQDSKKRAEKAREILGKGVDVPQTRTEAMEKALNAARDEIKKIRRKELGRDSDDAEDDSPADSGTGEMSSADRAREAAAEEASGGRPRLPGDNDVKRGELDMKVFPSSSATTGPLTVEVSSVYNKEQSDPPMRKHCFQYTIRITNNSETDTIQLLGRRFEIQTVGSSMKDVVEGKGVTGRTPVLKPGEVFEYTSTAPLSVRPIGTTEIAARMSGEYRYVQLQNGQETASPAQIDAGGSGTAELAAFHFIFPEDQQVKPYRASEAADDEEDDDEEDDEDDEEDETPTAAASKAAAKPTASTSTSSSSSSATLPGDADMKTGDLEIPLNDSSEVVTNSVTVKVTTSYRPERSEPKADKHCFAYNIRITNGSSEPIQLVSRRFEIQTVGSDQKDIVQGPGVTGRQPILKPNESYEYTSTAPLSVKPMMDKTPAVARMQGEYNYVLLGEDAKTPVSPTPQQAKMGVFHFVLPAMDVA